MLSPQADRNFAKQLWDAEENEERIRLSRNLNQALKNLDASFSHGNLTLVKICLHGILHNFIDEIIHREYFSLSFFLKDSSGFYINFLPSVIIGKKAYRFIVYFQADPDDQSRTISYILTRRHLPDATSYDYDCQMSPNHGCCEKANILREEIAKQSVESMSDMYLRVAADFAKEQLLCWVSGFVRVGESTWGFAGV